MRNKKAIDQETLNAIIQRVVEVAKPDKIILFGSAARDQMGANSDVDLLVVMPVDGSVVDKRLEIRAALHDVPIPIDVVVTTPEEFAWQKDYVGTSEWRATSEGKVLYACSCGSHPGSPARVDREARPGGPIRITPDPVGVAAISRGLSAAIPLYR